MKPQLGDIKKKNGRVYIFEFKGEKAKWFVIPVSNLKTTIANKVKKARSNAYISSSKKKSKSKKSKRSKKGKSKRKSRSKKSKRRK